MRQLPGPWDLPDVYLATRRQAVVGTVASMARDAAASVVA